jgi:hypothetical protein
MAPTIAAPSSATTTFTQANIGYNESYTATFLVTAKDSATPTPATAAVAITANWSDVSSGGTL